MISNHITKNFFSRKYVVLFYSIFRLLHILHLFKNYRLSHNPHFIGIFQICQLNLCATCVLHVCYRKKFTKIFKNSKKRRYKKIPKTHGFEDFCKCFLKRVIISWRTEERDGRPSSRTARVFELFSLDTPGFSGFLPLSYPMCGP